jgi:hypothetical protein
MTIAPAEGTILTDVPDSDGFDAFLTNLTGEERKRAPSTDEGAGEATENTETETSANSGENTEGDADEGPEQTTTDPDDAEVEIKVGEETKKATLKELKRLYRQEASLTQKSQKVAEAQRLADTKAAQADTALKGMLQRAQERFKPYAELDMLVLSQRMDTESFQQLRADAAAAQADVQFIQNELGQHTRAEQERAQTAYREAAATCVKELADPEKGIKGWGEPLYNELMAFADTIGLKQARAVVDPAAIRVLHMAHEYAKAQGASKAAAEKIERAPQAPTKVLKPGPQTDRNRSRSTMQTLRQKGDIDSAADAFLASFSR